MKNKYLKPLPMHVTHIDVYRVLKLFNITEPGAQHAIKKLMFAGQRGHKDVILDYKEAVQAIERTIQMLEEDTPKTAMRQEDIDYNI